jgi:PKD repeat protein
MAKTRLVAVLILCIMLLAAMPQLAVAAPLDQPVNYSPVNGATEIGPGHTFVVQAFSGVAYATQWQFRTPTGSYALPLYDTGIVYSESTEGGYPEGAFDYGKTYYWHMRVMNTQGEWSVWSAETSFTVIVNSPPSQPENFEPNDGATGVGLPVTLAACEFRDPNAEELVLGEKDTHAASQWQVTDNAGNYTKPLLGSSLTASTIAFVAATRTITDSAAGLAIFKVGDTIAVAGTTLNDGLYTVAEGSVAGGIVVSEALKNEAAGASVSIDSVTTTSLTSLSVAEGTLAENSVYYWHVRYQDSYGNWSAYSPQTSFTTGTRTVFTVGQPVNVTPFDGAIEISPDQKLKASAFEESEVRTHYASRWQVTRPDARQKNALGDYEQPLFDSRVSTSNKVEIAIPVGLLDYAKTYYWHVKYQDDTGAWSAWSAETSFTVVKNLPPSSPRNVEPLEGKTGVATDPVLMASDFSDYDATAYMGLTDSHAGSQWQVTDTAGNYASPEWDSGAAGPTTSAAMPKGRLLAGTPYYWHVRYQDSRGNWSGYSQETSFTTKSLSDPVPSFVVDKTDVVAGRDLVTFTDNSTPVGEIDSWSWDFGDETTETWTDDTRPPNGEISHKYVTGGTTYTAKLTVYNGAKPAGVEQTVAIVVHAVPVAGFTMTPAAPKAGKEITFKDASTPTADITSWEWQFDDGTTETWSVDQRQAADGQIKHKFQKSGTHAVSLTVKGALGESYYNKQVNVTGAGGFKFGLWMIAAGVGLVVVIAGVVYLLRARKGK